MQTVHVRINDAATGQPTPVRVRFIGPEGAYYPPLGRVADFSTEAGVDVGCHLQIGDEKFAFVEGSFEIVLPSGEITVDVRKGPEYRPIRETVVLKPGQISLRLTIERWIDLRQEGWFSGDADTSYISVHAALLEAAAENLAVVNLLASLVVQRLPHGSRHYHIDNIAAFSGQRPALERPGHMVVVNTRNEGVEFGNLNLLNSHRPIFPLQIGSHEGLTGYTLLDLADQCQRKGGLVVWNDFQWCWPSDPQEATSGCAAMAALILGKIDAVLTTLSPNQSHQAEVNWYDLLNCGVRVPLIGGSGKVSNTRALGDHRTYARIPPGEAFTYKGWVEAVRSGCIFITTGPLLTFSVNDKGPGGVVDIPADSAGVHVSASARGLLPFGPLELIRDGNVVASSGAIDEMVPMPESGWLAVRCGERQNDTGGSPVPAAHSAPVYVRVGSRPARSKPESLARVMAFFEEQSSWAEHYARWENDRQRQHVLEAMTSARQVLQQRAT